MNTIPFKPGDALLVVDIQNDFCEKGALAVPLSESIMPLVNTWIELADQAKVPVFVSRDWHPADHCSFEAQGGPWPEHCVKGSYGAEFHPGLRLSKAVIEISKAQEVDKEVYSALSGFDNSGVLLLKRLREMHIKRMWVCGLALDFCVRESAVEALKNGIAVNVLLPGTRSISSAGMASSLVQLKLLGAKIIECEDDLL